MTTSAVNHDIASELKPTACVLCSMNCGLKVGVEGNQITDIQADSTNPITQGHICNKAFSVNHYVHHKQRLTGPLAKRSPQANDTGGQHQAVHWDYALEDIGKRLAKISKEQGGDKIAIAGLGGQANHSDVLYGLSFLKSFNSSWFFSAYAQEKTQHHLVEKWMLDSPPHSMLHPDPWNSDVLVIIGCNPLHSNRGYKTAENLREFKKQGKQLIMIDPRANETARKADIHMAHKPGTDLWLFSAMVALIVKYQWQDQEVISAHTKEFEQIVEHFRSVDIAECCRRCDIEESQLVEITQSYAMAERGSLFWDTGIEWIPHTTLVSWLLRVLVVITGNYGRKGGNALRPGFMADGHILQAKKPFVAPASGIQGIAALGPFEMFSPNILVDEINAGNIKALIVSGANPLRSYANTSAMQSAFEKLELLVVLDTSYTETAMAADYVLACPGGYEKWEWSTFGRKFPKLTAHLRPPVIKPTANLKSEAEIFNQLIKHSGGPASAPKWLKTKGRKGWDNSYIGPVLIVCALVAAKFNPIQAYVRWVNWAYDALGDSMPGKNLASLWLTCQLVAFTRFRQFENLPTRNPFKLGKAWFQQILDNPNGSIMATLPWNWHLGDALGHKDKKIRLYPQPLRAAWVKAFNAADNTNAEFPLILAAGERSPGTANTIMRNSSWRKGRSARCLLKINPNTATELNLVNDDWVQLRTATGQVDVQVVLDKAMRKDNVSIPNGLGLLYPDENNELQPFGINANDLTDYKNRDEFTGIPFHKNVACSVTKMIRKN